MSTNLRHSIPNSLFYAFITFLLYECVWWLVDDSIVIENPLSILQIWIIDFSYCALFVFTSLIISRLLLRLRYFTRFTTFSQLLLCMLTLMINLLVAIIFEKFYNMFLPESDSEYIRNGVYIFCLIATFLTLLQTTWRYFSIVLRQKEQMSALQKKALQNQLNPHFVFNSLSCLSELIHSNPKIAEDYVLRLSKVYRFVLSHLEQDLASLPDSCRFIQDYVTLQQVRLPGQIHLEIGSMESAPDEKLFSLSLQLLVENAIKHNYPEEGEILEIHIYRDGDRVIVRNSLLGKSTVEGSFGIGLDTLTRRYEMEGLQGPVQRLKDNWFEVCMTILR